MVASWTTALLPFLLTLAVTAAFRQSHTPAFMVLQHLVHGGVDMAELLYMHGAFRSRFVPARCLRHCCCAVIALVYWFDAHSASAWVQRVLRGLVWT